ncbi:MAG TPA: TetR/AcrR family transcriptional regulator [Marmoricola sp.]|nr:TetR/AcrR family transcriptional regulator [Marmoricola sp.]HNO38907.1 TetR/AcrR family transcriptional regulator [Marmoricola sp.]
MALPTDRLSGLPKVPRVTGGRRAAFSASTKKTLLEVATELFTTRGYVGTSLDAVVAGAEVTKGALYHHFPGKQALFEAVFVSVEDAAANTIRKALKEPKDPWEKAQAGLRSFLDVVQDPTYQRVVIQEGPAILGYERFRESEERSSYGIVQTIVGSVVKAGDWTLDEEMSRTFSRIFFGAMSAAGEMISGASDAQETSAQVEVAISFILEGLRGLAESGTELPAVDEEN